LQPDYLRPAVQALVVFQVLPALFRRKGHVQQKQRALTVRQS
jgi:hypothetical protein